jgi:hypothetical protein
MKLDPLSWLLECDGVSHAVDLSVKYFPSTSLVISYPISYPIMSLLSCLVAGNDSAAIIVGQVSLFVHLSSLITHLSSRIMFPPNTLSLELAWAW